MSIHIMHPINAPEMRNTEFELIVAFEWNILFYIYTHLIYIYILIYETNAFELLTQHSWNKYG